MGTADLTGAWAKLVRADEHVQEIGAIVASFGEQDAKVGRITYRHQDPWHILYVGPIPDLPFRITLLAGDCLTNLRAALDYLVWQLVLREGKEPHQTQNFPICETREGFIDRVEKPEERGKRHPWSGIPADGDAWTILKQAQPCFSSEPQDHPLITLNGLVTIDKHCTLLARRAFIQPDVTSARISWRPGFQPIEHRFSSFPLSGKNPTEFARFRFADGVKPDLGSCMDMKGNLMANPTIGNVKSQVDLGFLNVCRIFIGEMLKKVGTLPRVESNIASLFPRETIDRILNQVETLPQVEG